jgi:hypothetical protein
MMHRGLRVVLCGLLLAGTGCVRKQSSLRKEADAAMDRGEHRKALALYEQELLRPEIIVWNETGARTRRRDKAAELWLLEELKKRSAVLNGDDPQAAFALMQAVSDYAQSRGLKSFHTDHLVPLLEKAGKARWPEVEALEAKGQHWQAMALAEELSRGVPEGGALWRSLIALGERSAQRERREIERLRSDPGAAWLHLKLLRRYLRPLERRHLREELAAKKKREEADDYDSTKQRAFTHPTLDAAKAVDDAFSAVTKFAWRFEQQGNCPAIAGPFGFGGGVPVSMTARISGCEITQRVSREQAQRQWTDSRVEQQRVPAPPVCRTEAGPSKYSCSGDYPNQVCGMEPTQVTKCDEQFVMKDVTIETPRDESVSVELTERSMRGTGSISVSMDGETKTVPVTISVQTLTERFEAYGKTHTKSIVGTYVEEDFQKELKAEVESVAASVRAARTAKHLAAAAAMKDQPDAADGQYVIGSVMKGDLPGEAAEWLATRHGMTAEGVGALLFGEPPPEEEKPVERAVKPTLAFDFPEPSKEMPPDVVAIDETETNRDNAGETGFELVFGIGTHQPTDRAGRFTNSGGTVGLRMLFGEGDADEGFFTQVALAGHVGFDLKPTLQGDLHLGAFVGIRPGALSLAFYGGVGASFAGTDDITPGAYCLPFAFYLDYGPRVAFRFAGPVDLQLHLRQGHRGPADESAFFRSGEVRAVLHVLDKHDVVSVGFRHTDYTDGTRPVGFTQLLVGYGGQ